MRLFVLVVILGEGLVWLAWAVDLPLPWPGRVRRSEVDSVIRAEAGVRAAQFGERLGHTVEFVTSVLSPDGVVGSVAGAFSPPCA